MSGKVPSQAFRRVRRSLGAALSALLLLSSCASTQPGESPTSHSAASRTRGINGLVPTEAAAIPAQATVNVRFGTNREPLPDMHDGATRFFTAENSGKLIYGDIAVTIDANHQIGDINHGVRLETAPRLLGEKEFLAGLREDLRRRPGKKLLIFIHGYNVSFEKAARRTAQLKYDLQFEGEAAFFSWPSAGRLLGYWADEKAVAEAEPFLREYLIRLVRDSGANNIYIIAHSMGNRAFVSVMPKVREALHGAQTVKEVLLAAPDIDAGVFVRDIVPAMSSKTCGTTVYSSTKDKALWGSWLVHSFTRRAGQRVIASPGIDSVNASTVDIRVLGLGHSYFAEQANLLRDIQELFHGRRAPQRTDTLEADRKTSGAWALRKNVAN